MRLSIVDRSGFLSDDLHVLTERRLLFALARFDSSIKQISVVFSDSHGPRGGIDKSCCITVKIRRAPDVTVSDHDSDVAACITRSIARTGRAVTRAVERAQCFDGTGPFAGAEG